MARPRSRGKEVAIRHCERITHKPCFVRQLLIEPFKFTAQALAGK